MTQLPWYPHFPKEWAKLCEGLTHAERGALQKVVDESWFRDPPCTILDTRGEFEQLLGSDWRKLLPLIRRFFTPDLQHPGRLRCDWLSKLHARQLARYENRARAGRRGGAMKAANQKLTRDRGPGQPSKPNNSRRRSGEPSSIASALLGEGGTTSVAMLPQKLDSSLKPRTGAAVAVASNAPAASQQWTGPDDDELRSWADGDPQIACAVNKRVSDMTRHIPASVQVPKMRHAHEIEALRAEYTERLVTLRESVT